MLPKNRRKATKSESKTAALLKKLILLTHIVIFCCFLSLFAVAADGTQLLPSKIPRNVCTSLKERCCQNTTRLRSNNYLPSGQAGSMSHNRGKKDHKEVSNSEVPDFPSAWAANSTSITFAETTGTCRFSIIPGKSKLMMRLA